eukprot:365876-Chlamydomonas_euryale.AAC.4
MRKKGFYPGLCIPSVGQPSKAGPQSEFRQLLQPSASSGTFCRVSPVSSLQLLQLQHAHSAWHPISATRPPHTTHLPYTCPPTSCRASCLRLRASVACPCGLSNIAAAVPKGTVPARKLQFFFCAASAQEELSQPSRRRTTPSGVNLVLYLPPTVPSCTSSETAARALKHTCQWAAEEKPAQREGGAKWGALKWVAKSLRIVLRQAVSGLLFLDQAANYGQPRAANQASLTCACWDTLSVN